MADKLADLSPEERAQRVAEMKAKMQSAAKKAKTDTEGSTDQPAAAATKPVAAAPSPAPVAVAATSRASSVLVQFFIS